MFLVLPFHCHSDKWALWSLNNFPLNLLCKVYNTLTVKLSRFIFYEFLGIAWFFLYFSMCQKRWGSRASGRSCLIPALAAVLESGTFYQTHFWNLAGEGRVPAGGYSQMHGPWLLLPAERMSTGSGLEADQPPEHSTMPRGSKTQQNLVSRSAPGHAAIVLEANCLHWQSKTWEKWVPRLTLPHCANTSRFTQLLWMPAVFPSFTPKALGCLKSTAQ